MRNRGMQIGVIGLTILALTPQAGWGQTRFETQIKTVVVVDANGVPVPDARVPGPMPGVGQPDAPWQRTGADGAFGGYGWLGWLLLHALKNYPLPVPKRGC